MTPKKFQTKKVERGKYTTYEKFGRGLSQRRALRDIGLRHQETNLCVRAGTRTKSAAVELGLMA